MKLTKPNADVYVPDNLHLAEAAARTTHLGIGAHQDDLEFMAFHGIEACHGHADRWFGGVTCTNGAGSPRAGVYAAVSDAEMQAIRRGEQRAAAIVGRYAIMIQLGYGSAALKQPVEAGPTDDLAAILGAARPQAVYTHNPADKHDTHVAVAMRVIRALRRLPAEARPAAVYGCEVWRDLDWLPDARKQVLDVSAREHLAAAVSGVFDSQIAGGKRYDLATLGRRRANATFLESHGVDTATGVTLAMDLRPLVDDPALRPADYVAGLIEAFAADVRSKLAPWM